MDTIIFDFDGVIINSRDVQKGALRESYRVCVGDGEPPYKEFFRLSGGSLEDIFTTLKLPLSMIDHYRKYSIDHIEEVKIIDGMEEVLKYLMDRRFKIGLCTGKDRVRTVQLLDKLRITRYFGGIVCSDDVSFPKPNAESLIKCMHYLGARHNDTVMIGDAANDIWCAHHAVVRSVAVTWGEGSLEDLKNAKPDYIVASPGELMDIIETD